MSTDRDLKMGRALGRIPLPELREGYYSELVARLEQARPASAPRRRRRARVLRVALVAAAVAAAAVAVFGLLAGAPGTRTGTPSVATAAELLARMDAAWTQASTIQGRVAEHVTFTGKDGTRHTTVSFTKVFAATAAGDWRLETLAGSDEEWSGSSSSPGGARRSPRSVWIYDSRPNTRLYGSESSREAPRSSGGGGSAASYYWVRIEDYWSGTGPAPLNEFFGELTPYSARIRAALADGDSGLQLAETTYDGRPAWSAKVFDVHRQDREHTYEIVVDRESGFPMRWSQTEGDQNQTTTDEYEVTELEVDQPIAARTFSTTAPRGWGKPRSFETSPRLGAMPPGYAGTCSLSQVERRVGYRPPVPDAVPAAYRLAEVATDPLAYLHMAADPKYGYLYDDPWFNASAMYRPLTSWHERDVEVGLTYRHGFDSFWIQAAPVGDGGLPMKPLVRQLRAAGFSRGTLQSRRLASGQFAGRQALSWYDSRGVGVLVWDDELAVYVGGSLTRAEALAVVGSLQPYRK
jgi:hypothetical protein